MSAKFGLQPKELAAFTKVSAALSVLSGIAQFVGAAIHSVTDLILITLAVTVVAVLTVGLIVIGVNRRRLAVPLGLALVFTLAGGAGGVTVGYFSFSRPASSSPSAGPGDPSKPQASAPSGSAAAIRSSGSDTPTGGQNPSATDPPPTASGLTGSSASSPSPNSGGVFTPSSHPNNGNGSTTPRALQFAITGSCTSNSGTLSDTSSGFTPGGEFTVSAWTPSGTPYDLHTNTSGTVAADGTVPWTWPCTGDPAGRYTTEMTDVATGRNTGRVGFTIGPAPTTPAPAGAVPETTGNVVQTWTDYTSAGGSQGADIAKNATVQIACKLTGFKVADGNTWWYRIVSSPWNSNFYASADAFYNNGQTSGSLANTPKVDNNVPDC